MPRTKKPSEQRRCWLAAMRVEKGKTQSELAAELEIPQTTYANYEAGTRTPRWPEAKKIGSHMGFDPVLFYEGLAS